MKERKSPFLLLLSSFYDEKFSVFVSSFYDEKFSTHKKQYILQCLLASLAAFIALSLLNLVESDLVIASIASSAFVIFTMPNQTLSQPRYVVGGYIVGMLVGVVCQSLELFFVNCCALPMHIYDELFGALAIGMSIFFMVVTDTEHSPAAAVALALVINFWNIWTLLITCLSVAALLLARKMLKLHLMDLV